MAKGKLKLDDGQNNPLLLFQGQEMWMIAELDGEDAVLEWA